jgi:hypothetical protein
MENSKEGVNMVKKYYKGIDKPGETLREAIYATGGRYSSCDDPKIMTKWVDDQQEAYMEKDWDNERFRTLIFDIERERLIDILKFERYNVDDLDNFNRDDLDKLIVKYKDKEGSLAVLLLLKEAFEKDFKNERTDWAYQRAWDDHNDMMPREKDDDDVWAEFYGLDLEIEGFDINGECIPTDECYICPACEEVMAISEHEAHKSNKEDEFEFYCPYCYEEYKYNDAFFHEANQHLPEQVRCALKV